MFCTLQDLTGARKFPVTTASFDFLSNVKCEGKENILCLFSKISCFWSKFGTVAVADHPSWFQLSGVSSRLKIRWAGVRNLSHSPTFANTPRMSSILVRGWGKTIKPWPGQDPTFGWVSSGQGMEKSIRSSVASLESPLPHTAASAAHASPQAGLHLRLHPRRHRHTLSHPWLMAMLQKGRDVFWRSRRTAGRHQS